MAKLNDLLADSSTTLADIAKDGWYRYFSSGGSWWFDKKHEKRIEHASIPMWIHELIEEAEERGRRQVQEGIKECLDLK